MINWEHKNVLRVNEFVIETRLGILSLLSLVSIILYIFIFGFVNTCFSRDKLIFLETFIFIFRFASYRYDMIKFV